MSLLSLCQKSSRYLRCWLLSKSYWQNQIPLFIWTQRTDLITIFYCYFVTCLVWYVCVPKIWRLTGCSKEPSSLLIRQTYRPSSMNSTFVRCRTLSPVSDLSSANRCLSFILSDISTSCTTHNMSHTVSKQLCCPCKSRGAPHQNYLRGGANQDLIYVRLAHASAQCGQIYYIREQVFMYYIWCGHPSNFLRGHAPICTTA